MEGSTNGNQEQSELRERYTKILRANGIEKEIKIVEVFTPGFAANNFASKCEVVTIHFEDGSKEPPLELFVKRAMRNNKYAEAMEKMQLFETESSFFNSILPHYKEFCQQKSGNCNIFEGILPKCFYADRDIVVLENLVKKGYIMLDKAKPHDMPHARLVMEVMAKFHAVSYVLIQEMGRENFLRQYPNTAISNSWSGQGAELNFILINTLLDSCIRTLEEHPVEGTEEVLIYIRELKSEELSRLFRLYDLKASKSRAVVLNHGDLWNCNMLFKEAEEEPKEVILIDLQTIHLSSLNLDLHFYIYTSGAEDWETLLRIYFDKFKGHVEDLKGTVGFTFEDLLNDYRDNCELGFVFSLYGVFGWEQLDEMEDPEKMKGDAEDLFNNLSVDTKTMSPEKGIGYSEGMVKAYRAYKKIISERS